MLEETVPKDDVAEEDLKSNVENDMTVVENENSDINGEDGLVNYKNKYRDLKRKLKCLLYEQECFHEELRKVQRKCLRVNKDKSFLLDRLLQYEEPDLSSSDEEMTSSSEYEDGGEDVSKKEIGASSNRKSTSKVALKPSSKTLDAKSKSNLIAGDEVRCRKTVNGKQCLKLVSVKVKSGICYTHRQQRSEEKQGASEKQSPSSSSSPKKSPLVKATPPPKHPGGKDIGQIREAMEASSRLSSPSPSAGGEDEDDELVIDVPQ